jgi:hypothetical protein
MVTFDPHRSAQGFAFDEELERLQALVADMEQIRAGASLVELAVNAPLLDDWSLSMRPEVCLVGRATGHPLLPGARRPISTSCLWLMSQDKKFARTLSRWYRLGSPADRLGSLS